MEGIGEEELHLQLEEGVCDLQHEDVRVVVLVADQHTLARPSHTMFLVVFLKALQAREHRGVFFGLRIFGAEGVVAERVQAYRLGLVAVEVFGEDGAVERLGQRCIWRGIRAHLRVGALRSLLCDCRHGVDGDGPTLGAGCAAMSRRGDR